MDNDRGKYEEFSFDNNSSCISSRPLNHADSAMNHGPTSGVGQAEGTTASVERGSASGSGGRGSRLPLPVRRTRSALNGGNDGGPAAAVQRPTHRLPTLDGVVINSPTYTDVRPAVPLAVGITSRCRIPKPALTRPNAFSRTPSSSTLDSGACAPPSITSNCEQVGVGDFLPDPGNSVTRGGTSKKKKKPVVEGERRLLSTFGAKARGEHVCTACGGTRRVACAACAAASKVIAPLKRKRSLVMASPRANRVQRLKASTVHQVAVAEEAFESAFNLPCSNTATDDSMIDVVCSSVAKLELNEEDRLNGIECVLSKARHAFVPDCNPTSKHATTSTRRPRLASASYTVPDRRMSSPNGQSENAADRDVGSTSGTYSARTPRSPTAKRTRTTLTEKRRAVRAVAKRFISSPLRAAGADPGQRSKQDATSCRQTLRRTCFPAATTSRTSQGSPKFVTLSGREVPVDFGFGTRRRSLPTVTFADESERIAISKRTVASGRKVKRRPPWRDVITILRDSSPSDRRSHPAAAETAVDLLKHQSRQELENLPRSELLLAKQNVVSIEERNNSEQSAENKFPPVTDSAEFFEETCSHMSPVFDKQTPTAWNVSKSLNVEENALRQNPADEESTMAFFANVARPPTSFWLEMEDFRGNKTADSTSSDVKVDDRRQHDLAARSADAMTPSFFIGETQLGGFRLDEQRWKQAVKQVPSFISCSGSEKDLQQQVPARQKPTGANTAFERFTSSTGLAHRSKKSTVTSNNESAAASTRHTNNRVSPSRSYSISNRRLSASSQINKQLASCKAMSGKSMSCQKSDRLTARENSGKDESFDKNVHTESNETNEDKAENASGRKSPIKANPSITEDETDIQVSNGTYPGNSSMDQSSKVANRTTIDSRSPEIHDSTLEAAIKCDEIRPMPTTCSPRQPRNIGHDLPIRYGKGGFAYTFDFVGHKSSNRKTSRIPQPKVHAISSPAKSRSYVVSKARKPPRPYADNFRMVHHPAVWNRRSTAGIPLLRTVDSLTLIDQSLVEPVQSLSAETRVPETGSCRGVLEQTSPDEADVTHRAEYLKRLGHSGRTSTLKDDSTDQSSGYASLTTLSTSTDQVSSSTTPVTSKNNDHEHARSIREAAPQVFTEVSALLHERSTVGIQLLDTVDQYMQEHPTSVLETASPIFIRHAADDHPEQHPLIVALSTSTNMSTEQYVEELPVDVQTNQLRSSAASDCAVTPVESPEQRIISTGSVRTAFAANPDVSQIQPWRKTSKKGPRKKSSKIVGRISLDFELRLHNFDEASVEVTGIEWSRLQVGGEVQSPKTMRLYQSVFEAIVLRNAVRPSALPAVEVSSVLGASLPLRLLAVAQARRQLLRTPSALVVDVTHSRFDRGVQSVESALQSERFTKTVAVDTPCTIEENYIRSKRYLEQCTIAWPSSVRKASTRHQWEEFPKTGRSDDVIVTRKLGTELRKEREAQKQSPSKIKQRRPSTSSRFTPLGDECVRSKTHTATKYSFDYRQRLSIPQSDRGSNLAKEVDNNGVWSRRVISPIGSPRRKTQDRVDVMLNEGVTEHRRAAGEPCWRTFYGNDDVEVDRSAFLSHARFPGSSRLEASRKNAEGSRPTRPSFIKYIPVSYESLLASTAPVIPHDQIDRSEWIRTQLAVDAERRRVTEPGPTGSGLCRARSDPSLLSLGSGGDRSHPAVEYDDEEIDWTAVSPEVKAFCRSRKSNSWRHVNQRMADVLSTEDLFDSVEERRFDPLLNEWHCRLNGSLLFQAPGQRPVFCAQLYAEMPRGPTNMTIYNLKVELACTALRTYFEPCAQVQFIYVQSIYDKFLDVIGSGQYEALFTSRVLHPADYDAVLALSHDAGGLLRHSGTCCIRSVADVLQVDPDRLLVLARCCDHRARQAGSGGPAPTRAAGALQVV